MKPQKQTNNLWIGIAAIALVIGVGSFLFHMSESYSYFDSLYFVVITMSTIGYGDIVPKTDIGKLLAMIYGLIGVPIFIAAAGIIIENRIKTVLQSHMGKFHKDIKYIEKEIHTEEKTKEKTSWIKKLFKKK